MSQTRLGYICQDLNFGQVNRIFGDINCGQGGHAAVHKALWLSGLRLVQRADKLKLTKASGSKEIRKGSVKPNKSSLHLERDKVTSQLNVPGSSD